MLANRLFMKKLNVGQICNINAIVKKKVDYLEYRKGNRNFFIKQKEGFYDTGGFSDKFTPNILILNDGNKFIEGETVFFFPHLEIYMSNQARYYKWFKTKEELENYVESEELKINKWVCL
jgi:hypothetical protein